MLDNQRYTTESEFVSCSFCGTTVSTALTVCPTCGNDIRPQRRLQIGWSTAIFFILLALLVLAIGLSGEGSTLRRTLQSSLDRLDQLASDLDPRLAASMTPPAQALLLPAPTSENNAAAASEQSVGEPAVTEVSLLPTDTPLPESLVNAATPILLIETETATPMPTQSPTVAATFTLPATATKAQPTPTVTATTLSIEASKPLTASGQISTSAVLSSLLAAAATPEVALSLPTLAESEHVSETSTINDVLSLLAPTVTRTPAPPTATDPPAPTATLVPLIYEVKSGDTLIVIAMRYNVALEELLAANGYNNGRTPVIRPGQKLVIPSQFAPTDPAAAIALASTATPEPPTATDLPATATALPATATSAPTIVPTTAPTNLTYVIKSGDTPSSIARRFGVSVNLLLAANGLTLGDATTIRTGQTWVIPGVPAVGATAEAQQTYIVQAGDTPMAIANRYGVSVDALLTANGLSRADATRIRPGQSLIIPGTQAIVATSAPTPLPPTATAVVVQTYVVQSGDTPLEIANRYGISVDALLSANGLSRADATRLRTGQSLTIPGGQASEAAATRIASTPTQAANTISGDKSNSSVGTVRLDAPQLVSPESGTAVSCGSQHSLVWNAVSFMRDSDRYMVHLGYVSGRDSAGTSITTWVLAQERLPTDPQWQLDNNLCSFTPEGFERQWRWYVEVIDTTAGNTVVSAPGAVYTFRWE